LAHKEDEGYLPTDGLYKNISELQDLLIRYATGEGQDEAKYKELRRATLVHGKSLKLIPEFVTNCRTLDQFWHLMKTRFEHYSERREFIYEAFLPILNELEVGIDGGLISLYSEPIKEFNLERVEKEYSKCFERSKQDPEGAITSARSLLESVCKHILDGAGEEYKGKEELQDLYKKAARMIRLAPEQHKEQVFKQTLQGCISVVEGLASMRNAYSDSHGKSKHVVIPKERHAKLAIGLACSMALFLLQSLEDNGYVKPSNHSQDKTE